MDELLAEVDVARTLAREAVARAEKTLAEANETLQILLGRYLMLVLVYFSNWNKNLINIHVLIHVHVFCS